MKLESTLLFILYYIPYFSLPSSLEPDGGRTGT
jgi:hypothetical protein